MTFWLFRGLRKGVVTTRYPAAAEPSTGDLPTPPTFDMDLLTEELAEAVIAVCPSKALSRDGRKFIYDVSACTACGRCFAVGGNAVHPSGVVELAATRRADLIHAAELRQEPR